MSPVFVAFSLEITYKQLAGLNQCRLLSLCDHLGIRGRTKAWISSFLSDRNQRVVLNGAQSSWIPVLSGVPQGTVLGPLLFLLYVNDITDDVSFEICLFADDCILYRQIRTPGDLYITPAGYYQTLQLVSHLADGLQYKEVSHSEHLA